MDHSVERARSKLDWAKGQLKRELPPAPLGIAQTHASSLPSPPNVERSHEWKRHVPGDGAEPASTAALGARRGSQGTSGAMAPRREGWDAWSGLQFPWCPWLPRRGVFVEPPASLEGDGRVAELVSRESGAMWRLWLRWVRDGADAEALTVPVSVGVRGEGSRAARLDLLPLNGGSSPLVGGGRVELCVECCVGGHVIGFGSVGVAEGGVRVWFGSESAEFVLRLVDVCGPVGFDWSGWTGVDGSPLAGEMGVRVVPSFSSSLGAGDLLLPGRNEVHVWGQSLFASGGVDDAVATAAGLRPPGPVKYTQRALPVRLARVSVAAVCCGDDGRPLTRPQVLGACAVERGVKWRANFSEAAVVIQESSKATHILFLFLCAPTIKTTSSSAPATSRLPTVVGFAWMPLQAAANKAVHLLRIYPGSPALLPAGPGGETILTGDAPTAPVTVSSLARPTRHIRGPFTPTPPDILSQEQRNVPAHLDRLPVLPHLIESETAKKSSSSDFEGEDQSRPNSSSKKFRGVRGWQEAGLFPVALAVSAQRLSCRQTPDFGVDAVVRGASVADPRNASLLRRASPVAVLARRRTLLPLLSEALDRSLAEPVFFDARLQAQVEEEIDVGYDRGREGGGGRSGGRSGDQGRSGIAPDRMHMTSSTLRTTLYGEEDDEEEDESLVVGVVAAKQMGVSEEAKNVLTATLDACVAMLGAGGADGDLVCHPAAAALAEEALWGDVPLLAAKHLFSLLEMLHIECERTASVRSWSDGSGRSAAWNLAARAALVASGLRRVARRGRLLGRPCDVEHAVTAMDETASEYLSASDALESFLADPFATLLRHTLLLVHRLADLADVIVPPASATVPARDLAAADRMFRSIAWAAAAVAPTAASCGPAVAALVSGPLLRTLAATRRPVLVTHSSSTQSQTSKKPISFDPSAAATTSHVQQGIEKFRSILSFKDSRRSRPPPPRAAFDASSSRTHQKPAPKIPSSSSSTAVLSSTSATHLHLDDTIPENVWDDVASSSSPSSLHSTKRLHLVSWHLGPVGLRTAASVVASAPSVVVRSISPALVRLVGDGLLCCACVPPASSESSSSSSAYDQEQFSEIESGTRALLASFVAALSRDKVDRQDWAAETMLALVPPLLHFLSHPTKYSTTYSSAGSAIEAVAVWALGRCLRSQPADVARLSLRAPVGARAHLACALLHGVGSTRVQAAKDRLCAAVGEPGDVIERVRARWRDAGGDDDLWVRMCAAVAEVRAIETSVLRGSSSLPDGDYDCDFDWNPQSPNLPSSTTALERDRPLHAPPRPSGIGHGAGCALLPLPQSVSCLETSISNAAAGAVLAACAVVDDRYRGSSTSRFSSGKYDDEEEEDQVDRDRDEDAKREDWTIEEEEMDGEDGDRSSDANVATREAVTCVMGEALGAEWMAALCRRSSFLVRSGFSEEGNGKVVVEEEDEYANFSGGDVHVHVRDESARKGRSHGRKRSCSVAPLELAPSSALAAMWRAAERAASVESGVWAPLVARSLVECGPTVSEQMGERWMRAVAVAGRVQWDDPKCFPVASSLVDANNAVGAVDAEQCGRALLVHAMAPHTAVAAAAAAADANGLPLGPYDASLPPRRPSASVSSLFAGRESSSPGSLAADAEVPWPVLDLCSALSRGMAGLVLSCARASNARQSYRPDPTSLYTRKDFADPSSSSSSSSSHAAAPNAALRALTRSSLEMAAASMCHPGATLAVWATPQVASSLGAQAFESEEDPSDPKKSIEDASADVVEEDEEDERALLGPAAAAEKARSSKDGSSSRDASSKSRKGIWAALPAHVCIVDPRPLGTAVLASREIAAVLAAASVVQASSSSSSSSAAHTHSRSNKFSKHKHHQHSLQHTLTSKASAWTRRLADDLEAVQQALSPVPPGSAVLPARAPPRATYEDEEEDYGGEDEYNVSSSGESEAGTRFWTEGATDSRIESAAIDAMGGGRKPEDVVSNWRSGEFWGDDMLATTAEECEAVDPSRVHELRGTCGFVKGLPAIRRLWRRLLVASSKSKSRKHTSSASGRILPVFFPSVRGPEPSDTPGGGVGALRSLATLAIPLAPAAALPLLDTLARLHGGASRRRSDPPAPAGLLDALAAAQSHALAALVASALVTQSGVPCVNPSLAAFACLRRSYLHHHIPESYAVLLRLSTAVPRHPFSVVPAWSRPDIASASDDALGRDAISTAAAAAAAAALLLGTARAARAPGAASSSIAGPLERAARKISASAPKLPPPDHEKPAKKPHAPEPEKKPTGAKRIAGTIRAGQSHAQSSESGPHPPKAPALSPSSSTAAIPAPWLAAATAMRSASAGRHASALPEAGATLAAVCHMSGLSARWEVVRLAPGRSMQHLVAALAAAHPSAHVHSPSTPVVVARPPSAGSDGTGLVLVGAGARSEADGMCLTRDRSGRLALAWFREAARACSRGTAGAIGAAAASRPRRLPYHVYVFPCTAADASAAGAVAAVATRVATVTLPLVDISPKPSHDSKVAAPSPKSSAASPHSTSSISSTVSGEEDDDSSQQNSASNSNEPYVELASDVPGENPRRWHPVSAQGLPLLNVGKWKTTEDPDDVLDNPSRTPCVALPLRVSGLDLGSAAASSSSASSAFSSMAGADETMDAVSLVRELLFGSVDSDREDAGEDGGSRSTWRANRGRGDVEFGLEAPFRVALPAPLPWLSRRVGATVGAGRGLSVVAAGLAHIRGATSVLVGLLRFLFAAEVQGVALEDEMPAVGVGGIEMGWDGRRCLPDGARLMDVDVDGEGDDDEGGVGYGAVGVDDEVADAMRVLEEAAAQADALIPESVGGGGTAGSVLSTPRLFSRSRARTPSRRGLGLAVRIPSERGLGGVGSAAVLSPASSEMSSAAGSVSVRRRAPGLGVLAAMSSMRSLYGVADPGTPRGRVNLPTIRSINNPQQLLNDLEQYREVEEDGDSNDDNESDRRSRTQSQSMIRPAGTMSDLTKSPQVSAQRLGLPEMAPHTLNRQGTVHRLLPSSVADAHLLSPSGAALDPHHHHRGTSASGEDGDYGADGASAALIGDTDKTGQNLDDIGDLTTVPLPVPRLTSVPRDVPFEEEVHVFDGFSQFAPPPPTTTLTTSRRRRRPPTNKAAPAAAAQALFAALLSALSPSLGGAGSVHAAQQLLQDYASLKRLYIEKSRTRLRQQYIRDHITTYGTEPEEVPSFSDALPRKVHRGISNLGRAIAVLQRLAGEAFRLHQQLAAMEGPGPDALAAATAAEAVDELERAAADAGQDPPTEAQNAAVAAAAGFLGGKLARKQRTLLLQACVQGLESTGPGPERLQLLLREQRAREPYIQDSNVDPWNY